MRTLFEDFRLFIGAIKLEPAENGKSLKDQIGAVESMSGAQLVAALKTKPNFLLLVGERPDCVAAVWLHLRDVSPREQSHLEEVHLSHLRGS